LTTNKNIFKENVSPGTHFSAHIVSYVTNKVKNGCVFDENRCDYCAVKPRYSQTAVEFVLLLNMRHFVILK